MHLPTLARWNRSLRVCMSPRRALNEAEKFVLERGRQPIGPAGQSDETRFIGSSYNIDTAQIPRFCMVDMPT
jgi:hypothetical protein